MSHERVRSFLISKKSDFWMMGGISVIVWAVLYLLQLFRAGNDSIELKISAIVSLFSFLTLLCNQPHFIMSYSFAYGQGKGFIKSNWGSLILVPCLLLILFGSAFLMFESHGQFLMGVAVVLLNVTIGWHYAKQVYGCMMVYSHYDKYKLSSIQKRFIQFNVLSLGALSFFFNESFAQTFNKLSRTFLGIQLLDLHIPIWANTAAWSVFGVSIVSMLYFVFLAKYRETKQGPSLNFLIPWVAFYLWWCPIFHQNEFYFVIVPFFHSLQYMPFSLKREQSRTKLKIRGMHLLMFMWIVGGVVAFQLIPKVLDVGFGTQERFKITFFFAAVGIFINVHHFFMDSVVWRLKDDKVRDMLVKAGK